MGKRSDFPRKEKDFYRTPPEAVEPLLPHLPMQVFFAEPCCGDGALVNHLTKIGHICTYSSDIQRGDDALKFKAHDSEYIITNPPWTRSLLHPMILHFSKQRPTWLLFDADWMHTKQSKPYIGRCEKIVSVGRVKWFPDSPHTGKDNVAWYLFKDRWGETVFHGR